MPCAWSGAWWVLDVMGGSCNSSGGVSCCAGEGSSSLSTSKHKHCNPLLREWGSNQYVKSLVVKGNYKYNTKSKKKLSGGVPISYLLSFMTLGPTLMQ